MRNYLYLLIGMAGFFLLISCGKDEGSEIIDPNLLDTSQSGFRYIWHDGEYIKIPTPAMTEFAQMGETNFTPIEGVTSSNSDSFFKINGVKTYFSDTWCSFQESSYFYSASGFNSIGSVYLRVSVYESDGYFNNYTYFEQLDFEENLSYYLIGRNSNIDIDENKVSLSVDFDKLFNCKLVYDQENDFYYYVCSDTIENYGEGTGVVVCN